MHFPFPLPSPINPSKRQPQFLVPNLDLTPCDILRAWNLVFQSWFCSKSSVTFHSFPPHPSQSCPQQGKLQFPEPERDRGRERDYKK